MKKQSYVLIIFSLLVIVGIVYALPKGKIIRLANKNSATNQVPTAECAQDSDCLAGGCSGQLCLPRTQAPSVVTTCEYKAEYACYKVDTCLCRNSKCAWAGSQKFQDCLAQLK